MAQLQNAVSQPRSRRYCSLSQTVRKSFPALGLALIGLLTGIRPVQAQDGRAILTKTLQTYQELHSYSGWANVETMMIGPDGKVVKQVGSSSVMKMQRPSNIYLFLQSQSGSRSIYSDGTNFSVYDATPDQYFTIPLVGKEKGLLNLLLTEGDVGEAIDPLFFLTQKSLPKELTNIRVKEAASFNGHAVYLVTGVINETPVVKKSGKVTTIIPTSYWTWWIDRTSSLLYKVEMTTPNVVKQIALGTGAKRVLKNVKGTFFVRHTVSELKPDVNLAASNFAFAPPKTATRKMTLQEARTHKLTTQETRN